MSFEFGQENNNTIDATSYGKLTVKLPLGNKQKFTNFAIANKAFKDSHKMDLGALAWVERSNKIIIEGGEKILFKGLTYGLITSPNPPHRVWLDRNLGATAVCADADGNGIAGVGDEACYGDLYQWGRAKDGHESRGSGATTTLASSITPATTTFIIINALPADWVNRKIDDNGALRAAAWADGGVNDICPAGFSVPTEEELKVDTTLATTTKVDNTATAFSSFLKLPASGWRSNGGGFAGNGTGGPLWSRSAIQSPGKLYGRSLAVYRGNADFSSVHPAHGFSVRCIKD
ncbi:hypothetical protein [uncultured Gammaproteobacteria bacterium]|nr:hypothetical protein [uncultured Gammaproteobacteria bacterium]